MLLQGSYFHTRIWQMIRYSLHYYSLYLLFFKTLRTLSSLNKDPIKQSQHVRISAIQHAGTV